MRTEFSRYRRVVDNDCFQSFYTKMPSKLRLAALAIALGCAPPLRSSETEYAALSTQADSADLLLISAYVSPRAFAGPVGAHEAFSGFIEKLALSGKPIIVLSFGSPYLLSAFPSNFVAAEFAVRRRHS